MWRRETATHRDRDVNCDGAKDLVFFRTRDAEFDCDDTDDAEGILRGETLEGMPFEGRDQAKMKCGKIWTYRHKH